MSKEDLNESILATDATRINFYEDFPKCSNTFLKKLKEQFDIRKMIHYSSDDARYLKGVQDVLDFIEFTQKQHKE